MARDPFDLDAGGNTADYVATTQGVTFAEDQYGNFQATFDNKYDEPRPKDDGTLSLGRPEFVTVGRAETWRAIDGGTAFVAADGDADKRVRANSGYGRLVERVLELVGKEQLIAEGRTTPYTSAFWAGLRFHWETEGAGKDYSFTPKGETEKKVGKTKGYNIPTEFLGGAPSSNGHVDVDSLGLDADTLRGFGLAAESADTPAEFQAKALSIALGVTDPVVKQSATAALAVPGLYEALRA